MRSRLLFASVSLAFMILPPGAEAASRGYLTTPEELARVRRLAEENRQPYQAAVEAQIAFAEKKLADSYAVPASYSWENNRSTNEPSWMTRMSTAAYGCALAYRLTQNEAYAGKAKEFILAIQQCQNLDADDKGQSQLNVSIHIPKFIYAADLLEGWPGWSAADRRALQDWICRCAYPISRHGLSKGGGSAANWAAWEQAAGLAFADYRDKMLPRFVGWTIEDGQFVGGHFVNEAWPEIYVRRTLAQLEKLRPLTERWVPFTTLTHADPLRLVGEPPTIPPPGGNTMRNTW